MIQGYPHKPKGLTAPDRDPFSTDLREIGTLIDRSNLSEALARIDQLLSVVNDPVKKARLLNLVGNLEISRSNYDQAETCFGKAIRLSHSDLEANEKAYGGQLRAFILGGKIRDAKQAAEEFSRHLETAWDTYEKQEAILVGNLKSGVAQAQIAPLRPPAKNSIWEIFGKALERAGFWEDARQALQMASERGSVSALVSLARIDLKEGNAESACKLAWEALRVSQFSSVSISAIPIVVKGTPPAGRSDAVSKIVSGLKQASPSVRLRGTFEVIKSLRSAGDYSWHRLATEFLAADPRKTPAVELEVKKLLLAPAARNLKDPKALEEYSAAVMDAKFVSPAEWLYAAKQLVCAKLLQSSPVDIERLIVEGCAQFGTQLHSSFLYGIARGAFEIDKTDIARRLFSLVTNIEPYTAALWGKAGWSLARLEEKEGNHKAASLRYDELAQNRAIPAKFRIVSFTRWLAYQNESEIAEIASTRTPFVRELIEQISDVSSLILISRRLRGAPSPLDALARQSLTKAEKISGLLSERTAPDPAGYPNLSSMAFRYLEFGEHGKIDALLKKFKPAIDAGAIPAQGKFWDFLGVVVRSFAARDLCKPSGELLRWAEALAGRSDRGLAIVRSLYGEQLIRSGDANGGYKMFSQVEKSGVKNVYEASISYYWLALRALKKKQFSELLTMSQNMLLCLPANEGIAAEIKGRDIGRVLVEAANAGRFPNLSLPGSWTSNKPEWRQIAADFTDA